MSNWRSYGEMPFADFAAELRRMGSPMLAEAEAIYAVVKGHARLFLAMAFHETKLGTLFTVPGFDASFKNPVALMVDGRYMSVASWEHAAVEWMSRLVRAADVYKGGVYARTTTLEDLVHVYAPASAGNDEARYVAVVKERLAAYGYKEPTDMPALNMTRGLVPLPGFVDEAGTFAKREGVGMNRLGPRHIDVLFVHRALGGNARGVADWLKRPDVQGLTDWVIDHTTAYMIRLVDVYGEGGDMTGWAQGPYREPVAGLRALTAEHGGDVNAVNRYGESIEVSGYYGDPISAACKRDLAQWIASRAHDAGITWDRYPLRPNGHPFVYSHWMSCGKALKLCAGPVVDDFVFSSGECTAMVRGILKAAQQGTAPQVPTPAPAPKPKYDKPLPIRALASLSLEDRAGLAAVVTKEGQRFEAVADRVVAIRETPRFRVANVASTQRVGPNIPPGEDFDPAWRFAAKDGEVWYVTPYWTRVRAQDTKVVGSEPFKA